MRVEFRPRAGRDLERIADWYFEQGGTVLAKNVVGLISQGIEVLVDNPLIAPVYDPENRIHRLVVAKGKFLVFYRVKRETVIILHVRRSERKSYSP